MTNSHSVAPQSAAGLVPDASIEVSVEAKEAMPPKKVAAVATCATAAKVPREEAGSSSSIGPQCHQIGITPSDQRVPRLGTVRQAAIEHFSSGAQETGQLLPRAPL